ILQEFQAGGDAVAASSRRRQGRVPPSGPKDHWIPPIWEHLPAPGTCTVAADLPGTMWGLHFSNRNFGKKGAIKNEIFSIFPKVFLSKPCTGPFEPVETRLFPCNCLPPQPR